MPKAAGEVVWDFVANRKPLIDAANDVQPVLKAAGDKGAKSFGDGFKANAVGRKMGDGVAGGLLAARPAIKRSAGLLATTAKAALSGAAIGAGIAASLGVVIKSSLESAANIKVLSDSAGVAVSRFTEMTFAASAYNIEQDKLADILRDTNDKFGDFFATGAGPLADFFDNVAPKVGLTAESFRNLSSDQALGLYVRALEQAGASQQDFTFYMEALASDATLLLPLLKDNGRELSRLADEAAKAGAVLSDEAAQGAFDANQKMEQLGTTLRTGVRNQIVEMAPEIEDLTDKIIALVPSLVNWSSKAIDGLSDLAEWTENAGTAWDRFAKRTAGNTARLGGNRALGSAATLLGLSPDYALELTEVYERHADAANKLGDTARSLRKKQEQLAAAGNSFSRGILSQQIKALEAELDKRRARADELQALITKKEAEATMSSLDPFSFAPTPSKRKASGGAGITRTAPSSSAAKLSPSDLGIEESLKETRDILREAKRLAEDAMTPLDEYEARLKEIASIDGTALGAAFDISPDKVAGLKADALIELGREVDNLDVAYQALGQTIGQNGVHAEEHSRVMQALNAEQKARIDEQRQAANEAMQAEIEKRLEIIDAVVEETDAKLELAYLSGDERAIEKLDRELRMLREKRELIRRGIGEDAAGQTAEGRVEAIDEAVIEGKARDAFKSGIRAAIDGDLGGFLENKLKNAASGMFDNALDMLFNALMGGMGGGGGLLGGFLGSLFSFDGGGFTGNRPRSGGMDGKGGFLAMLHGNETVLDHTKMGSMSMPRMPSIMPNGGAQSVKLNISVSTDDVMFNARVKNISDEGDKATLQRVPSIVSDQNAAMQSGVAYAGP